MVRVGLTGGIGSGKTTICRIWEYMGAYIIYADDLAKRLMIQDETVVHAIRTTFGDESYHSDGSLNRSWLAREAFENNRVAELNAIVHPAVYKASDELMEEAMVKGYTMAVREAAILLQNGRPPDLDKIVLVVAPVSIRTKRVVKRDGADEAHVARRIASQPDYEAYRPDADIVIENIGSLVQLEDKARIAYRKLTAL
jgi:dephospho-CoA kinase